MSDYWIATVGFIYGFMFIMLTIYAGEMYEGASARMRLAVAFFWPFILPIVLIQGLMEFFEDHF